jgi:soluble lytic murein transglycosylase-like protein
MDARRFNPSLIKYILILIALIVLLALIPSKVTYTAVERQIVEADSPPEAQNEPIRHENERAYIDWLIKRYSAEYGVSSEVMHHIVRKESTYNKMAVGDRSYICKRTGKISPSYGLVQINVHCWHPHVTIEQAHNPDFAIRFLAEGLAKNKCSWWSTCPY